MITILRNPHKGDLVVRHLHRYLFELIEGTEWEQLVIDEIKRDRQNAFDQMLPEYAALVANDRPEARFDAIVIDEAQDILTETNLEALNEVLHGGLEEGRWCIFLDGREQAKVYGKMEESALQRLRALSVYERLTLNCRNTRPIAQQTAVVSNSKWGVSARIDGRPVDFKPYRHRSGWLDELERVLKELTQDGVSPGRISVLVLRKKIPDQDKKRMEHIGLRRLSEEDAPNLGSSALEQTTWSTVSGFKGLENDVVVVAGVTDIDDDWDRSVAYVGMSRARSRLHVIIHEDCNKRRKKREKEWRARQDSDVEMLL